MKKISFLFFALIINTIVYSQSSSGFGIQYIPGPDMRETYDLELQLLQQRIAQKVQLEDLVRRKALERMDDTKRFYNSVKDFPQVIPNGWHKVVSMNNRDKCEEAKVFVDENKIKKYVIEDYKPLPVVYSNLINKGKAIVQLNNQNGSLGEMIDIYFLESISNPYSKTSPPQSPGKVSFFSTHKKSGNIDIYIDGIFEGTIKHYFDKKTSPNCEQSGTLSIEKKPGRYKFDAIAPYGKWSGEILIKANNCYSQGLSK